MSRATLVSVVCFVTLVSISIGSSHAAEKGPIKKLFLDPDARTVELFAATADGALTVKLVPLDEFRANVFIENTTDETLTVAAPPTIATKSVLPQFQQQPFPVNGTNPLGTTGTGLQQGAGQSTAGTLGPTNGPTAAFPQALPNQNPFGPGANFFSIPPDRSVWLKIDSVCLDQGKPTPRPKMPYVLVPVEEQVDDPVLQQLLAEYDPAKHDRDVLQAAAWHLASEKSWRDLATLTTRRGNVDRPVFDRETLRYAWDLVEDARQVVERDEEPTRAALR